MTDIGDLVHHLRNTPVRDIVRAVERDGFSLKRETATGARIYSHAEGRLLDSQTSYGRLPAATSDAILGTVFVYGFWHLQRHWRDACPSLFSSQRDTF